MNIKKVSSIILSATTTIWLSGAAAIMPIANAQTVAELQAQIAALLAQINALQGQLSGIQGGGASSSYNYTRDLTIGSKGDDVSALQNFLMGQSGAQWPSGQSATGYFGSITKAALANYQASAGISPAAGYFGSKTRAHVASMGGGAPVSGGQPSTGPVVTAPASGVAVSLASDSPTGSAISGAGQISVAKYALTAAVSAGATVTGLEFQKVGVVSDTAINNLYLADESGVVFAQFQSLSFGKAIFGGLNLMVNAGQTRYVTLRMDLSTSASAGNTIAWKLSGVTAGSAAVSGTPVQSNTLTVTSVSNPSLATVTWNFNTVGSSVDAGTTGVMIGTASVTVANSAIWLKSVKYTVVGSANMADIRNVKLMVNGAQIGTTIGNVSSDGTVVYDLGSNPIKLPTGNSVVDLFADVLGSPNRNFTVRVLRPYDLNFVDSQYNTGVSPTVTDDSNQVTINQGQITVSLASNTPTGNVPNGASNVTLAKFTIFASGEPVKVKFLDLVINQGAAGDTWATLANLTEDIQNISLVDDAGGQVGSTISTIASGTGNGQCTLTSATTTTCHFGTSASPINYIVPANTTRVISAKVDVLSTNDAPSLQAQLPAMTSNLEGQISFQTANSGTATGATLTVTTSPLTIANNAAFAAPTYVAGANNVRIASFVLTASSAEGAKVNSLTFDKDSNANFDMQNMKVMVGTTQFGTTRATIGDAETSVTFSGSSPIIVPAGGSVTIDVYADIITSTTAATHSDVIDYTSWTAVGTVSNSSITAASAVNGQNVVISSGPTLTLAADSDTPAAKQVVMGATDVEVFKLRLSANNVEDIKVDDIRFRDTITNNTAGLVSFQNMKLYDGALLVAGPLTPTIAGTTTSTVLFSLATPVTVTKNTSKTLTLKGDVATFTSGGSASNSGHTFSVAATADVTALGKDSNTSATVSGTPGGNAQTVYRTKLGFSSSLLGSASARTRVAVDDIATVNWTADAAFQAILGTVTVKFNGLAVSNGIGGFSVSLLDSNTNSGLGGIGAGTCTPGAGNSCSVTFSPQFTVSAGTTKASKIRVNSSAFFNAAQTSESLSVLIDGQGDVLWNDGTTAGINLPATSVPFTIVNVSYE